MFIAFPLQSRPDWRHPPWVTLLLILINVAIFVGPQRADGKRAEAAHQYYVTSALPGIELPVFLQDLDRRTDARSVVMTQAAHELMRRRDFAQVAEWLEQDSRFADTVARDAVLAHADPRWQTWQSQRAHYQQVRGEHFTENGMARHVAEHPQTLFTSMFLHGSIMHLVGNMVFLFAFGYTVELALGPWLYLSFYLLAGLSGGLLDAWARGASDIGSLGASGAISGLMAMYVVAYGAQRIKFFYQFLFYFDSVRAPAIILLPIWIATQLAQQVLDRHAGVAFMAHVGGLLGGAVLMGLYRWRHGGQQLQLDRPRPESALDAPADPELLQAQEAMRSLRFAQAKPLYAKLIDRYPLREDVLRAGYNLFRTDTASVAYHQCVRHALVLPKPDAALLAWQAEVLQDYLRQAMPRPRLSAERLARIGVALARGGQVASATLAESAATRLDPSQAGLPALRLALVGALLRAGQREQAKLVGLRLEQATPGAHEVRLAKQLLGT